MPIVAAIAAAPLASAAIGSAAIGAVASTSAAKSAAKTAANASQTATDATLAANQRAQDLQQANTAVAREQGDRSLTQLGDRLGLNGGAAPQVGSPNYDALIAERPDVAAAIDDPNGGFQGTTRHVWTAPRWQGLI